VGSERDLFGATSDRSAHGLFGVFVRPGGVVGLLPCVVVVVVVAVGVVVVGAVVVVVVVGAVVGATVRDGTGVTGGTSVVDTPGVGTAVGAELGPAVGAVVPVVDDGSVEDPSVGPLVCSSVGVPEEYPVGRTVSAAASAGGCVVRCCGFVTASGSGINGVSRRGPPSRLLLIKIRYPTVGTANATPVRRITRRRRPVASTKTGGREEGGFTIRGSYTLLSGHVRVQRKVPLRSLSASRFALLLRAS
jgi:hypothetical protein